MQLQILKILIRLKILANNIYVKLKRKKRLTMTSPNGLNYTFENPAQRADGSWHVWVTVPDGSQEFQFNGNDAPLGEGIDLTYLNWQTQQTIAKAQAAYEAAKQAEEDQLLSQIDANLIGQAV